MGKPRILWVEDSARFELANLLGPIYASNKYELVLAEDATTATRHLQTAPFDAVIMDIRIPPGRDRHWVQYYERNGADKATAQLGLTLLSWLLQNSEENRSDKRPPAWVRPERIAVFSVEERYEIGEKLLELGIQIFEEKRPGLRDTALLDLINQILNNGHNGNGHLS